MLFAIATVDLLGLGRGTCGACRQAAIQLLGRSTHRCRHGHESLDLRSMERTPV